MDEGDEDQAGHGDYGDGAHHLDVVGSSYRRR